MIIPRKRLEGIVRVTGPEYHVAHRTPKETFYNGNEGTDKDRHHVRYCGDRDIGELPYHFGEIDSRRNRNIRTFENRSIESYTCVDDRCQCLLNVANRKRSHCNSHQDIFFDGLVRKNSRSCRNSDPLCGCLRARYRSGYGDRSNFGNSFPNGHGCYH